MLPLTLQSSSQDFLNPDLKLFCSIRHLLGPDPTCQPTVFILCLNTFLLQYRDIFRRYIIVGRTEKFGSLEVDGKDMVEGSSAGPMKHLTTDGTIYIGNNSTMLLYVLCVSKNVPFSCRVMLYPVKKGRRVDIRWYSFVVSENQPIFNIFWYSIS